MDPSRFDVFSNHIEKGFQKSERARSLNEFAVMPMCIVNIDDDIEKASQPARENIAFYVGGMGARNKNFYNDYAKRIGFEDAAIKIQDLFLDGKRAEACAAVPQELVDQVALVGSRERIADKLAEWKEAGNKRHVDTLIARTNNIETIRFLAEQVL